MRTWTRGGYGVGLRVLSRCVCLCDGSAEGVNFLEDTRGQGGVCAGRLCSRDKLLPDKRLETEIEPRRVWQLCQFCCLEEVAETVDEMATPLMKLDDGCLDRVDEPHVWVGGHGRMENAGNVLFRAFKLLCEEYGLLGKVCVDGEGPAIDGDLSCTRVSVARGREKRRTRLKFALFAGRGLADVQEVAKTCRVQKEVVKEVLLWLTLCSERRGEDGPEGGDGLHRRLGPKTVGK